VRAHRVGVLRGDRLHRVESVHGALHDDRHVLPANRGELGVGHADHGDALEHHAAADDAGGRAQQLGDREQQRRLTAAGLAYDADELAPAEVKADMVDSSDIALLGRVLDAYVADAQDGFAGDDLVPAEVVSERA
jgi:hypothetical protein